MTWQLCRIFSYVSSTFLYLLEAKIQAIDPSLLPESVEEQVVFHGYAHMLTVVAVFVVNFFSFLVIAPSHQLQSGRK